MKKLRSLPRWGLFSLFFLFGFCGQGAARELQLVFEIIPAGKAAPAPGAKKNLEVVRLADGFYYTIRDQKMRVFDFRDLKVTDIRKETKFDAFPMPALIDERDRAFNAELDMHRTLKEANVAGFDAEKELFYAESRFQLESGMLRVLPITYEPDGRGGYRCMFRGEFVGGYTLSGKKPSAETLSLFEHYLLYSHKIHPQIRKQMIASGALPSEMIYRTGKGKLEDQITWRLVAVEEKEDSLYSEALRFQPLPFSTHPLRQAIYWATFPESCPIPRTSPNDFGHQFNEHFDHKNYLDALLAAMEYYLQTGASLDTALEKLDPFIATDKQLAAFLDGLDVSSNAAAVASLKSLSSIPRQNLVRGHIVEVMMGTALSQLGKYEEAEKYFQDALKQNPNLAGVFKELGDLYSRSDRYPEAWKCYAVAIRLAPKHPMLQHFMEREESLFKKYPDHF